MQKAFRAWCWHRFEIVESLRKLILISMLTAVSPNSIAYFNVALAVSFVAFGIFCHFKPFADPSADRLQICALLVTWLTIFYGLVSASTKYGLPDTAEHVDERSVQVRRHLALTFARVPLGPPQRQGMRSAGLLACDDQHRRRADAARRDLALEEAQTSRRGQTHLLSSQASFLKIVVFASFVEVVVFSQQPRPPEY
jgi:hypothetical protein